MHAMKPQTSILGGGSKGKAAGPSDIWYKFLCFEKNINDKINNISNELIEKYTPIITPSLLTKIALYTKIMFPCNILLSGLNYFFKTNNFSFLSCITVLSIASKSLD